LDTPFIGKFFGSDCEQVVKNRRLGVSKLDRHTPRSASLSYKTFSVC